MEEDQHPKTLPKKGEVFESEDTIVLEKVPIITPNRDVVASDLTFQVNIDHLLVLNVCLMYSEMLDEITLC